MRHFLFIFVTMTLVNRGFGQTISYSYQEELPYLSGNISAPVQWMPFITPAQCLEPMILYHVREDPDTWVCGCEPLSLYFAETNTCHEVYTRGPCQPGNYFYLPMGEVTPRCTTNPCLTDGLIPFNGGCYALETTEPCMHPTIFLKVHSKTFQIQCLPDRRPMARIANAPRKKRPTCPPGTRTTPTGSCRPSL